MSVPTSHGSTLDNASNSLCCTKAQPCSPGDGKNLKPKCSSFGDVRGHFHCRKANGVVLKHSLCLVQRSIERGWRTTGSSAPRQRPSRGSTTPPRGSGAPACCSVWGSTPKPIREVRGEQGYLEAANDHGQLARTARAVTFAIQLCHQAVFAGLRHLRSSLGLQQRGSRDCGGLRQLRASHQLFRSCTQALGTAQLLLVVLAAGGGCTTWRRLAGERHWGLAKSYRLLWALPFKARVNTFPLWLFSHILSAEKVIHILQRKGYTKRPERKREKRGLGRTGRHEAKHWSLTASPSVSAAAVDSEHLRA